MISKFVTGNVTCIKDKSFVLTFVYHSEDSSVVERRSDGLELSLLL